ncbi:MAG: hypothetical protein IT290_13000, partial [Deltaproteobacteria bacterium]|nr:hypothetical protein [Deltaproteobacteria bacterium]
MERESDDSPVDLEGLIEVRAGRAHNITDLSLDIPKRAFVVFMGPSGAGKSTLLFDIVGWEADRRSRGLLDPGSRFTAVESRAQIRGLGFTVGMRATRRRRPRESLADLAGLYAALSKVFLQSGTALCIQCHSPLKARSDARLAAEIRAGDQVRISFGLTATSAGVELLADVATLGMRGFERLDNQGERIPPEILPELIGDPELKLRVAIDEFTAAGDAALRLFEARVIEQSLRAQGVSSISH